MSGTFIALSFGISSSTIYKGNRNLYTPRDIVDFELGGVITSDRNMLRWLEIPTICSRLFPLLVLRGSDEY
jgi:hypothetical protein